MRPMNYEYEYKNFFRIFYELFSTAFSYFGQAIMTQRINTLHYILKKVDCYLVYIYFVRGQ